MIGLIAGVILELRPSPFGPVVNAVVGGKRTKLVLDTGASKTVLVRKLGGDKTRLSTAGDPVDVARFVNVLVTVGDRAISDGYALQKLRLRVPRDADGVAGNDLVLAGLTRIDGPRSTIEFGPTLTDASALELTFKNGLPIVRAEVRMPGKPPVPVEALVDTGSMEPLLLTPRLVADLAIRPETLGPETGLFSASGLLKVRGVAIEGFRVGEFGFQPKTSVLAVGDDGYDCIIGWPILATMVTTFDPIGHRIWFTRKAV